MSKLIGSITEGVTLSLAFGKTKVWSNVSTAMVDDVAAKLTVTARAEETGNAFEDALAKGDSIAMDIPNIRIGTWDTDAAGKPFINNDKVDSAINIGTAINTEYIGYLNVIMLAYFSRKEFYGHTDTDGVFQAGIIESIKEDYFSALPTVNDIRLELEKVLEAKKNAEGEEKKDLTQKAGELMIEYYSAMGNLLIKDQTNKKILAVITNAYAKVLNKIKKEVRIKIYQNVSKKGIFARLPEMKHVSKYGTFVQDMEDSPILTFSAGEIKEGFTGIVTTPAPVPTGDAVSEEQSQALSDIFAD